MPCPFAAPSPPEIVLAQDVVEVPLVRGDGDPRPRVQVQLDEEQPPVMAILDLGGGEVRMGALLAARQGIPVQGRLRRHARLPWFRVGDLLINDLEAEITAGEELTIGAFALGVAVQVSASDGAVRWSREGPALLSEVGEAQPMLPPQRARWTERGRPTAGAVHGAVSASLWSAPPEGEASKTQSIVQGLLRLRSDRVETVLSEPGTFPEVRQARRPGAEVGIGLGQVELPVRFRPFDESLADPRAELQGELGADVLAGLDIAIDPESNAIAIAQAHQPQWTDLDGLRLYRLDGWALTASLPVPGTEDSQARFLWSQLASARWEGGDIDGALLTDRVVASVAGERCELWQAMGERALRAGQDASEAFAKARAPLLAWLALTPQQREAVRWGRSDAGREPPSACVGAPEPVPVGEGALRKALATDDDRPAWGAALARLLYEQGRVEPALALVRTGWRSDPHPLTTALVLGPELLEQAKISQRSFSPLAAAAGLVLLAHGAPEPRELASWLEELRVSRPGDPSVLCQVALYDALLGPAMLPTLPEADCLTASLLLARYEGRSEDAALLFRELARRWPDLVSDETAGEPGSYPGSTLEVR